MITCNKQREKKLVGIVQYTSRTLAYNNSCGALTAMEIRMQWEDADSIGCCILMLKEGVF